MIKVLIYLYKWWGLSLCEYDGVSVDMDIGGDVGVNVVMDVTARVVGSVNMDVVLAMRVYIYMYTWSMI